MSGDVVNLNRRSKSKHLGALFAGTLLFTFLLTSCVGSGTDLDSISVLSDQSASVGNVIDGADQGPTMLMNYTKEAFVKNPIASFMYFVPLIAPTRVDNISSVNNDQQVGIISHELRTSSRSFSAVCEFEILGSGFHMNTFEPAGMMAAQAEDLKNGKTLTNLLDYIKIEGQGYGVVEVKGRINNDVWTVTEVNLNFNVKDHTSPVTIGLYDIKPEDGEYHYENRSNEVVVRVNSLVFKKTEQTPRMGIKVASIARKNESAGFFGRLKAVIANMLIKPLEVDPLGNMTMLEYGDALLRKKPAFTFPKAQNIKEIKVVDIDIIQE